MFPKIFIFPFFKCYFTLLYFFSPFVLYVCICSLIYLFSNTDGPGLYNFISSFLNVAYLTFDQKLLFLFHIIPAPVVALLEYIPNALNKKITPEIQCLQLKRVRYPQHGLLKLLGSCGVSQNLFGSCLVENFVLLLSGILSLWTRYFCFSHERSVKEKSGILSVVADVKNLFDISQLNLSATWFCNS